MVQLLIRSPRLLVLHSSHNPAIIMGLSYQPSQPRRLFLWLLPFKKSVRDDEATLTLFPSVAKCKGRIDRLHPRIDRGEADNSRMFLCTLVDTQPRLHIGASNA
jgi:hypothetical protein